MANKGGEVEYGNYLVLILDKPHPFKDSRAVGEFLGLAPAKYQLGDNDIRKAENHLLPKFLIQSAHNMDGALGQHCDLRKYRKSLRASQGKSVVAITVTASWPTWCTNNEPLERTISL